MVRAPTPDGKKGLLRLIACGGTEGDGERALIDRLLAAPTAVVEDGGEGFLHFSTARRRFVVVGTPGGEPYTRIIAAGAGTPDLAVIRVDAERGLLSPARRHSVILGLMGVRHVVLAVNRGGRAEFSRQAFEGIEAAYRDFAKAVGIANVLAMPVCAVDGDNVVAPSRRTAWYAGPTLMEHLETVALEDDLGTRPFRLPVQQVIRAEGGRPGCAGRIASGAVAPGDAVRILPSGRGSRIARIATAGGDLARAVARQSVTLVLEDDPGVSRGDVIAAAGEPVEVASQFEATLAWTGDAPLLPGRDYRMEIGACTATATVMPLKYRLDTDTLEHAAATKLERGEIGVAQLELDRPVAFEPFEANRDLGSFLLVDRLSGRAVAAGLLRFALRRAKNVHWQAVDIDRRARAAMKGQKPCVLWFTGLPASGKSTIANLVEKRLYARGVHTYLLDGDNVRHGLNKDLGFTEAARVENIRRVAEVAALMADAGLVVLAAFISPFESERRMARGLLPEGQFLEIFIDTPLAVAEARDPKGLYRKARRGELANFTGIDSPYERPAAPDITIDGAATDPAEAAERIVAAMRERGL